MLLREIPKKSQRVLELCCGTGRAAVPLAEAGHRVTGVDIDPHLLAIAGRKCKTASLDNTRLKLVRGDVLKMKFAAEFDWAFLIFNTLLNFSTLAEQDRLMRNVRAALRPGGRFWVDVFNPDLSILASEHHACFDSATFYVQSLGRSVHRTTEIRRSAERSQLQHVTFHYTWADADGELHNEQVAFDMTWMFPRELILLLERHGFIVEALYGDHAGGPVTPDSPRLIALAKKQ